MALKERIRNWLQLTPDKAPAPPAVTLGSGALGGNTRARVSLDNPSISYLSGLTLITPLSQDPEGRWRGLNMDDGSLDKLGAPQILELLVDLSPEISRALWDLLRLANPGWEVKAFRPGTETIDTRAQAALDLFLEALKQRHGSFDVLLNRLYIGAFMRGAFFAELVLDNAGRLPLDIAVPDAVWTYFRIRQDPQYGPTWEPYQFQGGKPVSLARETIRYVPVDPLPANPYGRPLASPALFTALFTLALLHDLKRVVMQQGYPRFDLTIDLEALLKTMPPELASDVESVREWLLSKVADVGRTYRSLAPDDAYIHTSDVVVNKNIGTVDSASLGAIGPLIESLERQAMRALKSSPLLMGLTGNSSETQSNRQWELVAAGTKSLQHLCEGLLEHLLTIALRVQGIQSIVQFRFSEIRAAELLRDAQVQSLTSENAFFAYQAGWISQDEAAQKGVGAEKADQPEPRAAPGVVPPTGANPQPPGQVQADPGSQRGLDLQELATLVHGRNGDG